MSETHIFWGTLTKLDHPGWCIDHREYRLDVLHDLANPDIRPNVILIKGNSTYGRYLAMLFDDRIWILASLGELRHPDDTCMIRIRHMEVGHRFTPANPTMAGIVRQELDRITDH